MLLRLIDPGDRIDSPHARLSGGKDIEDLGPGETLIPALDIRVGVLGQTGIILQYLVAGLNEVVDGVQGCDITHVIRSIRCSRAEEEILVVKYIRGKVLRGTADGRQDVGGAGFEFVFELSC